tara:strand:- start:62 stop:472 length:411 start_codon:yes stop_codon:yes gene_type:complete
MIKFKHNDGGRSIYFGKRETGDCVVRAIAIATKKHYRDVWHDLLDISKRTGLLPNEHETYETYLTKHLGWTKHKCPRRADGKKYLVRQVHHEQAIILTRGHLTAMVDGVINDTFDCGDSYHNRYFTPHKNYEVEKI